MNSLFLSLIPSFSLLFILQIPPSSSLTLTWYQNCTDTYTCGSLAGIHYPFRGNTYPDYCGYPGLELNCNPNNITTIHIANLTYRVLSIDQTSHIMKIAREDLMESICPRDFYNTTLDYRLFDYASSYMNITFLYGCPDWFKLPGFTCRSNGAFVLVAAKDPGVCNVSVVVPVPVPVLQTGWFELANFEGLGRVLKQGVEVRWKVDLKGCIECTGSGGRCGYDFGAKRTTCFCPNPPYRSSTCSVKVGSPLGSTSLPGT